MDILDGKRDTSMVINLHNAKNMRWIFSITINIVIFILIFRGGIISAAKLKDINDREKPSRFYIISLLGDHSPVLKDISDTLTYNSGMETENGRVENRIPGPSSLYYSSTYYDFYIPINNEIRIEKLLNSRLETEQSSVEIDVLSHNRNKLEQVVRVQYNDDDFQYTSEYKVLNQKIIPIRYGQLTKHDGYIAFETATKMTIISVILTIILMCVYDIFSRRKGNFHH